MSHSLIFNVTEAVEQERKVWQNRSLDAIYPIVYFDALGVKVQHEGRVINKAIHLALGVNLAGQKELLGLWMTQNESSKFWLSVLTEFKIGNSNTSLNSFVPLSVSSNLFSTNRRRIFSTVLARQSKVCAIRSSVQLAPSMSAFRRIWARRTFWLLPFSFLITSRSLHCPSLLT
ncbi:MAG: hypothetical protein HC840_01510 [Leptolyngbyaceae cyanobacterium RM2_2_4]|nr:hypothetical protein [Leptolyngbyaceae cyanobacterium RM2_2_4]